MNTTNNSKTTTVLLDATIAKNVAVDAMSAAIQAREAARFAYDEACFRAASAVAQVNAAAKAFELAKAEVEWELAHEAA